MMRVRCTYPNDEGSRDGKNRDTVGDNPYLHFTMSEAWAALAATVAYIPFHLSAFAVQRFAH